MSNFFAQTSSDAENLQRKFKEFDIQGIPAEKANSLLPYINFLR
jgi:hypothetical protein